MRKAVPIIAAACVAIAAVVVAVVVKDEGEQPTSTYADAPFERPMRWGDSPSPRAGTVDVAKTSLVVGGLSLPAPQPVGSKLAWSIENTDGRLAMVGEGTLGEATLSAKWTTGRGNPNSLFEATVKAKRGALAEPIVSRIELGIGEVSYVDATLARVAFADSPIRIGSLTHGPIVWRNGDDVLTIWQWSADRVQLSPREDGGTNIELTWWDPALRGVPEECAESLSESEIQFDASVALTFGDVPDFWRSRLPGGVSSAVVPIFVDPVEFEEPKIRDAASASAEDYAARARTIALGHSSPADARHGNGGLVGLDVGGTVLVPSVYTMEPFEALESELEATAVELLPQSAIKPANCEAWAAALASKKPTAGTPRTFDGKFPNLFAPGQTGLVPAGGSSGLVWHPTQLTGRRKDVVTQALSSTYLSKLAQVRGIAVLEIPLVATRNPLVAASAEALLDPERGGNWTIQEDLARALGEVELLSEMEQFDFVSITELTNYTLGTREVAVDASGPNTWLVHNHGDELVGFTIVVDGVATATVDGNEVETSSRRLPNDEVQTWIWWDLAEGATYELALTQAEPVVTDSVVWSLPPNAN